MWFFLCARIVVRAVVLVMNICGIPLCLGSSAMADTIAKTEEAMRGSSAFQEAVQVFLGVWRDAGDSNMKKAQAIFNLLWATNAAGFLWMIIKCLCSSMGKWAWMKTAALVSAMIIASFGSGGVALIAKIAVAVTAATELAADINEAIQLL
ncbi:unnamed protein product [Porites lobata]|uniref:Uncharacterized protein n=1 Tax=Porites lobata TaxID=104759 RepID=A0ABN8NVX6_9CNID|nr:unnamed protein product [Porites lobata]